MSSTFTDGNQASGLFNTPPSSWLLEANKRLLKNWLRELAPSGKEEKGITQADLTTAETSAWKILLSRFIGNYDVSTWSSNPPIPLFEIWDLMASAYILRLIGQRSNTDENDLSEDVENLLKQAGMMIRNIIDPEKEGDRAHLMNSSSGLVLPRKKNMALPIVSNPKGVVFFPTSKGTTDIFGNRHDRQSIETFLTDHLP